jgi:hypothetical protein
MFRRADRTTIAAVVAWTAFGALALIRLSGARLAPGVFVSVAVGALAFALLEASRDVVSIWRGPQIVTFSGDEAEICGPEEAEAIRAAAKLRGTLGGAGHVHSARLLLPAIAWVAAAVLAGGAIRDPGLDSMPGWPVAVVAAGIAAAVLFPARPFYYREAIGGRIVLHPRSARAQLITPIPVRGEVSLIVVGPSAEALPGSEESGASIAGATASRGGGERRA